ncbi:class I SAM-dependent DNA methyltransferase [Dasania marina]|uniref:class I SAM-dependent DNA methyltransferase n=1 Tax=Dasania marina TaxID=471499 RepID=UPI0004774F07|nr:class I SAM-dependent methyltransferase [Dasania marina]
MNNEWDEYAEGWDADDAVQEYANKAFKELANIIELNDSLSIFDFGCGTGSLTEILSPRVKDIIALDGSSEMIKHLANKNLNNVSTIPGFLTQELIDSHPHLTKKFDLIVASSVCGFLPDYNLTLGLLKSLLKTDGIFVQWDWLSDDDNSGMGLSEANALRVLKENGFVEVETKKPFSMKSSKGTLEVLMAIGKQR